MRRRRRFSRKQLANQRRFAAMARARATAARRGNPPRTKKRATKRRGPTMARKKRAASRSSKRRRRSTTHRRAGVRLVRRGQTVYQGNPRHRRRRHHYRRNPGMGGIMTNVFGSVKDAAFVGVGAAVGRTVGNIIPIGGTPLTDFAKGVVVAVGVRMLGRRFLGPDAARMLAAGALYVPFKNAITSFVPAAGAFLGDYADLAAYSLPGLSGVDDTLGGIDDTLSSYSMGVPGM